MSCCFYKYISAFIKISSFVKEGNDSPKNTYPNGVGLNTETSSAGWDLEGHEVQTCLNCYESGMTSPIERIFFASYLLYQALLSFTDM